MQGLMNAAGELAKRMAFEAVAPLRDCCSELLSESKPRMFGMVFKCLICENRFKTVEAGLFPVESTIGKFSEAMSRGSRTQAVVAKALLFSKKRFPNVSVVEAWIKARGFLAPKVQSLVGAFVVKQAPDAWFAPNRFPQVMMLEPGVLAELGVKTSAFAGRKATDRDVLAPPRRVVVAKEEPADGQLSIEKNEDGTCPVGFPVKWSGKCWTMKAAAKGFPQDVVEKPFHEAKPAVADGEAEEVDEDEGTESMDMPADGKCPEGWEKQGDKCVKVGAQAATPVGK